MATALSCVAFLHLGTASAFAADPTGDWLDEEGFAHIRVAECGGSMWGAVVWEKTPGGVDSYNPDPAKKGRPTLGMAVLLDMKKQADADAWKGLVYNSRDGRSYETTITPQGADKLQVRGCVLGFLCGGQTWTRVAGPIPSSPTNQKGVPKGMKGAAAPGLTPAPGAPAAAAPKAAPKMAGAAKGARAPGDIGDICLIPEIATYKPSM